MKLDIGLFPSLTEEEQRAIRQRNNDEVMGYVEKLATKPDYTHWGRFDSWTARQAVVLILDCDPECLTYRLEEAIAKEYKLTNSDYRESIHQKMDELAAISALMQSTIEKNRQGIPTRLQDVIAPPQYFLAWAGQKKLEVNPELRVAVEEFSGRPSYEELASVKGGDDTEYRTPYLDILHAAISQFFDPRQSVDPKKAEVVEWVNAQLAEKGLASENISQAIFTIIKPIDHDPKKRRG